jgi:hydrogenase maturation protease
VHLVLDSLPDAGGGSRLSALVLGIGNDWRSDDAAGLEVARGLRAAGMRALERGGEPTGLIDVWEGEEHVILVDAVSSGAAPGTIHRFDADAGPLPARLFSASTHHLGVAEAVELGRSLGRLPDKLEVIGIEGSRFGAGRGLSPKVRRAVEALETTLRMEAGPVP